MLSKTANDDYSGVNGLICFVYGFRTGMILLFFEELEVAVVGCVGLAARGGVYVGLWEES